MPNRPAGGSVSSKRQISYIVASDVNHRDGIGLETYVDGELVMEIFRDDSEQRTYVTLFADAIDFGVLEASIEEFKTRIDQSYIEQPNGSSTCQ
ncbi:hypothetical protein [Noviluteimonas gilva]|uniref:Uncharacterized protein n=1 Tax=Noviluteimonas gilva TaxID=2682097 RepID=A0A7C9HLW7_9GAMM|nr:hypothetical protein [Lysobacter gilvus]MUV14032.1 hypothetical protein [Lysobacter gilvus]